MRVLNFSANPYMLIPLIGIGIYGFLFYKIYKLRTPSSANRWFLVYLFTSIAAGIMDFFGSISTTAVDATFWYLLFFVLNTLSFSALFGFMLSFTHHQKLSESLLVKILLYIPALIVSYFLLFTDIVIVHDAIHTTMIHQMWRLTEGPWRGPLYFGWIQLTVMTSVILFLLYARKVHDRNQKIQAILYAVALVVQVIVDVIILNIFPIVLNIFIIPDGIVAIFFLGSILAYGILKYNLFVINPAVVASTIVDTMNDMVIVVNRDSNIEYTNQATQKQLGFEPQDSVGRQVKVLFQNQWEQINQTLFTPALKGETISKIKTTFYKKDGTSLPISLSASPVLDDHRAVAGIVCVATDISQLLQLQDMTVQRNTLNTIIESVKDAVLAFDKNHTISIFNSASVSLFAIQHDAMKGQSIDQVVKLSDQDKPVSIMDLIAKSTQANQFQVVQLRTVTATDTAGKQSTVNVTITPVRDDAGLDLAGFIVLQDLSKEQQLEEMKLDFVSIAAHELRTPTTAIRGYLGVFLDSYGAQLNEDQTTILRRTDLSAQRLAALIDNLLNVSKIERGDIAIHDKPMTWLPLIQQVVTEVADQAKDRQVTVVVNDPAPPLPQVRADATLIDEVVINLINNAIAYTPGGGTITISFETTETEVITHIADTGEGIPKEAIPHLFTKFFRVSHSLEQTSKGTGLGLYISKSIMDLHKGKLWVESEPGKGSIFSFSLPIALQSAPQQPAAV